MGLHVGCGNGGGAGGFRMLKCVWSAHFVCRIPEDETAREYRRGMGKKWERHRECSQRCCCVVVDVNGGPAENNGHSELQHKQDEQHVVAMNPHPHLDSTIDFPTEPV